MLSWRSPTLTVLGLMSIIWIGCGDDNRVSAPIFQPFSELGAPFADSTLGIGNVSAMAFGPEGRLFVCNYKGADGKLWGEILVFEDQDADGRADTSWVFATGLDQPAGLAFLDTDLYVSQLGSVVRLVDLDGDHRADSETLILKLFKSGTHKSNGVHAGPDGRLYVAVGSQFNTYAGAHEYRATILRMDPDGGNLEIFAQGLRNAYDFTFSRTGEIFATDNSMDNTGDDPPDELNHIVEGGHYGLPQTEDEVVPSEIIRGPIAEFPPHASATGLDFNDGTMFPGYESRLFVALYMTGKILSVELTPEGDSYRADVEEFITFPEIPGPYNYQSDKEGHSSYLHRHPVNVLFGPEGYMYLSALGTFDSNAETMIHGAIYRLP